MILDVVLFVAGTLVVGLVLVDLASTTISLSSVRGPLSSRLSELVWALGSRTAGTSFNVVRRGAGPMLVVLISLGWLFTLTLGWSLIFSVDGALASTASQGEQSSPVRWIDALFFVFGNLIGRGSSSLSPDQAWWSSLVALMSLTGLALITLALAWILPVVSAVVQKRSFAAQLSALGGTPQDIVLRCWNGRDLGDLNLHLLPLISELTLLAQRHLAYPVIHYFHSSAPRTAIGPRIAALDDALTIIDAAGLDDPAEDTGLGPSVTDPLRQAVSDYLSTLEHVFITASDEAPPHPDVDRLVEEGIADADRLRRNLPGRCEDLEPRRSLLLGYVRHDGWTWNDVTSATEVDTSEPDQER